MLAACTTTRTTGGSGSVKGHLPGYFPFNGPKPDLPGTAAGVQNEYLAYPKDLVRTVEHTPGSGGDVTAMVIQYFPPPVPMGQNAYWQELNKQLGVTFKPIITSASDYTPKLTTTIAGGDLPDFTLILASGVPHQADFVQAKCANLDKYLLGDAVKDYPNLANIPASAWKTTIFKGSIYGLPVPRGVMGGTLFVQQNLFDAVGLARPTNADDFMRLMKDVTQPNKSVWGMGASKTHIYNLDFFQMMFGAPNEWKVNGGKFQNVLETEENKEAVAYMRQLFQAGIYHPDANTMTTPQAKTAFIAGKFAAYSDGFPAYQQHWETVAPINPGFKVRVMIPFGHGGGKGRFFYGTGSFGNTVIKKASEDRVKELLRIANFLAAPFGSKEYQLVTSGVKGIDFTTDEKNNPIPTERGQSETTLSSGYTGTYVVNAPIPIYEPRYPDYTRTVHQQEMELVPMGIPNPRIGLYSETLTAQGPTLTTLIDDRLSAIIAGRAPMSDYDALVRDWKSQGGDQMRSELEAGYQKSGGV